MFIKVHFPVNLYAKKYLRHVINQINNKPMYDIQLVKILFVLMLINFQQSLTAKQMRNHTFLQVILYNMRKYYFANCNTQFSLTNQNYWKILSSITYALKCTEAQPGPSQTSKMESFATVICKYFKALHPRCLRWFWLRLCVMSVTLNICIDI